MKSIHIYIAGLGLGLSMLGSCGDNDELVCAPGTFKDGKDCAAIDPNDAKPPVTVASPVGGRRRTAVPVVTIRADEPARIIYTTDGSEPDPLRAGEPSPAIVSLTEATTTVKYFGVDRGGNVESTHTETWELDATGPGPVTNLAVSGTGNTANLTWTNPTDADYAGTLVVRATDVIDARPTPGKTYAAADSLSSSLTVVAAVGATQASDPGRAIGPIRYVVWTYDDLGNYGPARVVEGTIGTFDTSATFTFDTATDVLTPTVVPTGIDLTGTTAERASTTVTLHLKVKNTTTKYFTTPKILVPNVTNATFNSSDGTADGSPFASLGQELFAPGETRMEDLEFTGAAASTLVTIQLSLGHHPWVFGSGSPNRQGGDKSRHFVDLGSGQTTVGINLKGNGRWGNNGAFTRPGRVTAQRFFDLPTSHGLERWDMTTQTMVGGQFASRHVLNVLSDGVYLYAIIAGAKRGGTLTVHRLDERLVPLDSLDLGSVDRNGFVAAAISPDKSLLAVPRTHDVVIIDLASFSARDTDPSAVGVQGIPVPDTQVLRSVAFFSGSSGLLAVDRSGLAAIIKFGFGGSGQTVTTADLGSRTHAVLTAPDGRIWIAGDDGLKIFDPSNDGITDSAFTNAALAMTLVDGNIWVLRSNRTTLDRVDGTGAIQQTLSIATTGWGHWLGVAQ